MFKHADGRQQKEDPSKPEGIIAIANAIPGMGALSILNLASNGLGELVLPEGWTYDTPGYDSRKWQYTHTDGRAQKPHPGNPEGIIAIADAISDMGALVNQARHPQELHPVRAGG
jgi:hypothetical protein